MRYFQNILTLSWLLFTSLACAANQEAAKNETNKLVNYEEYSSMEKQSLISNFKDFYSNKVLGLSDKQADRKFIAQLIHSPEIPPSVELVSCQSGANQLLKLLEPASIEKLTLYGSLEALKNAKECWIIQFQSMFSGGVSAYVEKDSNRNLLVILNSEG